MSIRFATRISIVLAAYLFALIPPTVVATFLMCGRELSETGTCYAVYWVFPANLAFLALLMLVPFCVIAIGTEIEGIRTPLVFVLPAGAFGLFFSVMFYTNGMSAWIMLVGLLTGLLSGAIYWRIAGRHAGLWHKPVAG